MASNPVHEIEQAIGSLNNRELEELYGWLDLQPNPLDDRMKSDLLAGRMDSAIFRALDEGKSGLIE